MKRLVLALVFSVAMFAQEAPEPHKTGEHAAAEAEHKGGHEGPGDAWKWANFAILAAVLGFMLSKALPPFFASRTAEIQKGIAEAQKAKAEAEARAAEMERRLASLSAEVEGIRAEAKDGMAREAERLKKDAEAQIARVQAQAEQEVAAMTKHAAQQLKAHSAQLALELAEQRIKARMDGGTQTTLVDRFVAQLENTRQEARL